MADKTVKSAVFAHLVHSSSHQSRGCPLRALLRLSTPSQERNTRVNTLSRPRGSRHRIAHRACTGVCSSLIRSTTCVRSLRLALAPPLHLGLHPLSEILFTIPIDIHRAPQKYPSATKLEDAKSREDGYATQDAGHCATRARSSSVEGDLCDARACATARECCQDLEEPSPRVWSSGVRPSVRWPFFKQRFETWPA